MNFTLNNQTFLGCCELSQAVDKFDISFKAKAKPAKGGKIWDVFNLRIPGCELLGRRRSKPNMFIEKLVELVKEYNPRMPHQCPMKKVDI